MAEELSRKELWGRYWHDKLSGSKKVFSSKDLNKYPVIVDFFHKHLPKGKIKVLEVGGGPGELAKKLKERNPKVDIVGADVEIPSDRGKSTEHLKGEFEGLPFKDESFDAMYSSYTLAYTNLPKAAKEMWRVLKPGAKVVLLLHTRNSGIKEGLKDKYYKARTFLEFRKREILDGKKGAEEKAKIRQEELDEVVPILKAISSTFRDENHAKEFFEDYGFKVEHIETVIHEDKPNEEKNWYLREPLGIGLVLTRAKEKGPRKKRAPRASKDEEKYSTEVEATDMPPDMEGWIYSM